MKKTTLAFFAVALIGVLCAFATTRLEGELVGKIGPNQWRIIDPDLQDVEEEGGWECLEGNDYCKGILLPGAQPDQFGFYSDSEVDVTGESEEFKFQFIEVE
jgi:hypothetical protein